MTSRTSIKDMITCTSCNNGKCLELIQHCPIVYECGYCGECVEVSCGNVDCMDCADSYPQTADQCEG